MKSSVLCAATVAVVAVSKAQDTGTDSRPLVSSEALQDLIKIEALLQGSQQLQDFAYSLPERNRVFGGEAHNETVQWIYDALSETGYYDVTIQPFVELFSGGSASVTVNGVKEIVSLLTYTPRGSVNAPVVAISNLGCDVSDFPSNVTGNVALISRGSCTFAVKATNAKTAGAAAALVYDNINGSTPISGTLGGQGNYVPIVGITQAAGQAILAELTQGPVTADMQVNSILENRTTMNVIAETKMGDHDNVLALGAHTDSVEAGPGINDDGSGTVGILEVAKSLVGFSITNAIRFCFWSAEEYGLLGSTHYVKTLNESQHEVDKVRAYLNFDMIASPNYVLAIYDGDGSAFNKTGPAGSAEIEHNFEAFYALNGHGSVPTAFDGRSDYGPFLDVGIAAGGIFSGAEGVKSDHEAVLFGGTAGAPYDVCYHQACDNITNINHEVYLLNTRAIADAVAMYALSFDSLGPKSVGVNRGSAAREVRRARRVAAIDSHDGHDHGHGMCGHGNRVEL